MINIVTVVWNDYDFANLLVESITHFSQLKNNIIVIDNSKNPQILHGTHQFFTGENIGHGEGLNLGVKKSHEFNNPYVMFVDSDCHFVRHGWDRELIELGKNYDIIGGKGVPQKPIRPACLFMKREFAKNDWSSTPGYKGHRVTPEGFDVAIRAYNKLKAEGRSILLLDHQKGRYDTLNGEEFLINDNPFIYHHWHGSSLTISRCKKDNPNVDLIADKEKLFSKIPWRIL